MNCSLRPRSTNRAGTLGRCPATIATIPPSVLIVPVPAITVILTRFPFTKRMTIIAIIFTRAQFLLTSHSELDSPVLDAFPKACAQTNTDKGIIRVILGFYFTKQY
ncbi:hypothetical protein PM082_014875 [Marasmius tenuissimus]|nr:hypothetical protein PM082_014875 [Marasmius tenuissimus]